MSRKMKDSGIEWIGEIPENLNVINTKYLIKYEKGKNPENTNIEGIGIPYVGASDLDHKNGVDNYSIYTESDVPKCQHGDILILWDGARAGLIGNRNEGAISSTIVKLQPETSVIDKTFYFYYLKGFENFLFDMVGGTTIPHMNRKFIEDIKFIDFSLVEQTCIANYLGVHCALIDQTIEKQKQVIYKLKEYKQAVITEAVTKGLHPNAQMKDSGIEWIGEIPEECKVIIVKRIFKSVLGKMVNDKPTGIEDSLEKYLCALNVHFDGISLEIVKEMYFSPKEKKQYELMNGDLLVVEGGAGAGGASIVNFCDGHTGHYIQNSIHLIRSANGNANLKYLFYNLYSLVNRGYIDFVCNKATIPHFTKEKLLNVPIVNRSLLEQTEITVYLDKKCETIDEIIRIKASVLSKLESYKKSLIYECVTGKREVK